MSTKSHPKNLSKAGGRFYVLYIDFQKAFDSLDHYKVFSCLNKKGITGKFFGTLVVMYSNIKAQVKVGGKLSPSISCNMGLKQGDLSSPLIFNIYNELANLLRNRCNNGIFITKDVPDVFCLMFADDIANCADKAFNLQRQLTIVENFCDETNMTVNLNKTEIIVSRNGGPLREYERWKYEGHYIKITSFL